MNLQRKLACYTRHVTRRIMSLHLVQKRKEQKKIWIKKKKKRKKIINYKAEAVDVTFFSKSFFYASSGRDWKANQAAGDSLWWGRGDQKTNKLLNKSARQEILIWLPFRIALNLMRLGNKVANKQLIWWQIKIISKVIKNFIINTYERLYSEKRKK